MVIVNESLRRKEFGNLLEKLAASLDIGESQYEQAETAYKAVGNWLGKEDSPLAKFKPVIFAQGSFRLGTVVKPIGEDGEYDVDLALLLFAHQNQISQSELKQIVRDRLRQHEKYRYMLLPEKRRCWTLQYSESAKFHLDIVPAIPNTRFGEMLAHSVESTSKNGILITDNVLNCYSVSNPVGYAEWFKTKQIVFLNESELLLGKEKRANIEQLPSYQANTTLQKVVQILKRNRDYLYSDDENRPISIIITTLAARAYQNQANVFDALEDIIARMPLFIETRGGDPWVSNPVNLTENFADKWKTYPIRQQEFIKWLKNLSNSLKLTLAKDGLDEQAVILRKAFGENPVNEAISRYGDEIRDLKRSESLFLTRDSGMLSSTGSIRNEPHRFFGDV